MQAWTSQSQETQMDLGTYINTHTHTDRDKPKSARSHACTHTHIHTHNEVQSIVSNLLCEFFFLWEKLPPHPQMIVKIKKPLTYKQKKTEKTGYLFHSLFLVDLVLFAIKWLALMGPIL